MPSASKIRLSADWSFETAQFFVGFYAEDEDVDPSDDIEDDSETIEAIRNGDLTWFCAAVRVYLKSDDDYDWQEIGTDYLGCCAYNSVREFYTGHRNPDPTQRNTLANKDRGIAICHYFPDMVRIAISDARERLATLSDVALQMRVVGA